MDLCDQTDENDSPFLQITKGSYLNHVLYMCIHPHMLQIEGKGKRWLQEGKGKGLSREVEGWQCRGGYRRTTKRKIWGREYRYALYFFVYVLDR